MGGLRCKKRHWLKQDGSEKMVKLTEPEVEYLHITWRKLFVQGVRCIERREK